MPGLLHCAINWDVPDAEWDRHYNALNRPNLLQSRYYASGMHAAHRQKSRRGIILIDNKEAGLVQLLETGLLWNAVHAVILDRGPLWFDGYGGAAHCQAFFKIFNHQYPNRFGRKRRILPEINDGPTIRKLLEQVPLARIPECKGYQTIWLDLNSGEDEIKASLRKNWRGALNKAERSEPDVKVDQEGRLLPWMLAQYALDKKAKRYKGPPLPILHKIAGYAVQGGNCLILQAVKDNKPVSGILIFSHGKSATYQAGWTNEAGRKLNANHLLLWRAINVLKNQGVQYFDLGGVNDETAKGVKEFKEGMGGKTVRLVGHYT